VVRSSIALDEALDNRISIQETMSVLSVQKDGMVQPSAITDSDALPAGTSLFHGNYTVSSVVGSGGFGILYLAKSFGGEDVIIKECFSGSHCRRDRTRVVPRTLSRQSEIAKIVRNFLVEARQHSAMSHPNIARVHQVFQENGTAYIALDYVRGPDLVTVLDKERSKLTPERIVYLAMKLIDAVSHVHSVGFVHCDIAPDNILINENDEPVLIDFGAARALSVQPNDSDSRISIVKDGYSPPELYLTDGKRGPWTDIYSLAATLSEAISGVMPVDSQRRIVARAERTPDPQPRLAGNYPGYPDGFLESIDKAMNVLAPERYRSTQDWLADLGEMASSEGKHMKLLEKALGMRRPARASKKTATATLPVSSTGQNLKGNDMALDITKLGEISGFIGGCLVDSETGMMMAAVGGGNLDLEAASAANCEVVRAKNNAIKLLSLNDTIEDILISLGKQYHLIRPLEKANTLFLYVALDRKTANLGMARVQVKQVEQGISI
jgi:serine/threonine protein kinase